MVHRRVRHRRTRTEPGPPATTATHRLLTDGGEDVREEDDEGPEGADRGYGISPNAGDDSDHPVGGGTGESGDPDDESGEDNGDEAGGSGLDRSNVEVTSAGEAEPVDPKWEKPDPEDIPEFEVTAGDPMVRSSDQSPRESTSTNDAGQEGRRTEDPTAGMPNTARSPGDSRIKREGTEGYVAALELCARLPEDVRLPEAAADLVPAAVEAELEQDIQSFAAAEFDNPSPHVDVLDFVDRDGEIWVRLRLGIPSEAFDDLDPEAVRSHALRELEGLL